MAIRREELLEVHPDGQVVAFPVTAVRRRAARQSRIEVMRRRVVLGGFLVVLVGGILMMGGTGTSAPASAPGAPPAVTLGAGETLWSVAQAYGPPGGDLRGYVDALIELNDLAGAPSAGMRLQLPK